MENDGRKNRENNFNTNSRPGPSTQTHGWLVQPMALAASAASAAAAAGFARNTPPPPLFYTLISRKHSQEGNAGRRNNDCTATTNKREALQNFETEEA